VRQLLRQQAEHHASHNKTSC